MLLAAEILCVWVFVATTAAADTNDATSVPSLTFPHSQNSGSSRLDKLEKHLADAQEQLQAQKDQLEKERAARLLERDQWEKKFEHLQREIDQCKQRRGDTELFKQNARSARSDDWGTLEVTVNHLAQTTSQLEADVQALQTADSQHVQAIQAARDAGGSDFVHWGSSTCGGTSELMYSGIIGGSQYTHTGGAANALCLTLTPVMGNKSPAGVALLYSAEFETEDAYDDLDPVCAVCRSPHSATVMVPGTNVCSQGWTLQYSGYIMAGYYGHQAASEYICVDSKMETVLGSNSNHDGYTLYYTKTRCGGVPCPPYQNDKAVTCAVCSK